VDAYTPDALSRAPLKLASKSDHHIDGIIAVLQVTDEKLKEIKEETQKIRATDACNYGSNTCDFS
jgi:hypothetical protein